MNKSKYSFIRDPGKVDEFFGWDSIFNLKKDIKGKKLDWEKIQEEILNWIINGPQPPQYSVHIQNSLGGKNIEISKIRISDDENEKGKSAGLRLVVFIERRYNVILVMHLFSKKEKNDLTQKEKNKLSKWFKNYVESEKQKMNGQHYNI